MPLYVTNGKLQLGEPGQLAAQRACCCDEEGDNPEDCVCPDFCIFKVEIVSPFQLTTPADPCESQRTVTGAELGVCVDLDLEYPELNGQPCVMASEIYSSANSLYAVVAVCHQTCGASARVPGTNLRAGIFYDALASIGCTDENSISARLILNISWRAGVVIYSVDGLITELSRRIIVKNSIVDPFEFLCAKKANATCLEGSDSSLIRAAYATSLPLNLTVSHDSPGLGSWGAESTDTQSGDQTHVTPHIEQIINDFAPTFRITQRPSCRIVDCDCSTDVCGLVADVRAYPGGPLVEWILCKPEEEQSRDQEFSCTIEGVSYTCLYKYRELTETKNGVSVSIHRFIYERFANPPDVSGFPRERKVADLWCDGDGWMMDFQTVCYRVDLDTGFGGGYEEDRAVGEILCGPACGNDGSSRAPGDPIPFGSAVEVIGVPGFPYSEGDFSCDIGLGERMSVEIRQTLTC